MERREVGLKLLSRLVPNQFIKMKRGCFRHLSLQVTSNVWKWRIILREIKFSSMKSDVSLGRSKLYGSV